MIEKIEVRGFRSLVDFSVELNPGINILVGPNGSGKSNFVAFLDFVSELLRNDLNAALLMAGGTANVFSRERLKTRSKVLTFKIFGKIDKEEAVPQRDRRKNWDYLFSPARYKYSCEVEYDQNAATVYVKSESIEFFSIGGSARRVNRSTKMVGSDFVSEVRLVPKTNNVWKRFEREGLYARGEHGVTTYLSERMSPEYSILMWLMRESSLFDMVYRDVVSLASVNINPKIASKDVPITNSAEIDSVGSGLASLLYHIDRNNHLLGRRGYSGWPRLRVADEKLSASILSWIREINPDIKSVRARLSPADVLFKASAHFESNNLAFPLARLSDGTVKWICLVAMILADTGYGVIEEPENFLHPGMQEKFVELCRSSILQGSNSIILITTHSESLLNQCEVKELIMFDYRQGRTNARRPANRDQVAEAIGVSEHGLGYFYRSGSIDA